MTSKHQCKDLSRRCESIGFQKFVVTYWPSSWLRPCSLCGEVSWNWISNASRTLRSNFLSSTFKMDDLSHSNPFLQLWAWFEMPDKSHFLSVMDFWCCSRRMFSLHSKFLVRFKTALIRRFLFSCSYWYYLQQISNITSSVHSIKKIQKSKCLIVLMIK